MMTSINMLKSIISICFILISLSNIVDARMYHWGEITGSGERLRIRDSSRLSEAGFSIAQVVANQDGILAITTSGELVAWGRGYWCQQSAFNTDPTFRETSQDFFIDPTILNCGAIEPRLVGAVFVDVALGQFGQIAVRTRNGEVWTWGPEQWSDGSVYRAPFLWAPSRDPNIAIAMMTGALQYIVVSSVNGSVFLLPEPPRTDPGLSIQILLMWNLFPYFWAGDKYSVPIALDASSYAAAFIDRDGDGTIWFARGPPNGGAGNFGWAERYGGLRPTGNLRNFAFYWGSIANYSLLTQQDFVDVAVADNLLPEYDYSVSFFWLRHPNGTSDIDWDAPGDGRVVQLNIWLMTDNFEAGFTGGPRLVEFPAGYVCRSMRAVSSLERQKAKSNMYFILEHPEIYAREVWGFGTNTRSQLFLPLTIAALPSPTHMKWLYEDTSGTGINMRATKWIPRTPTRINRNTAYGDSRIILNREGKIVIWGSIEENNPAARSLWTPDGKSWVSRPLPIDNLRVMNGERVILFASLRVSGGLLSTTPTAVVTERADCFNPSACPQSVYTWGLYVKDIEYSEDDAYRIVLPSPVFMGAPGGCGNHSSNERIVEISVTQTRLFVRTNIGKSYFWGANDGGIGAAANQFNFGQWTEISLFADAPFVAQLQFLTYVVSPDKQLLRYHSRQETPEIVATDFDPILMESDHFSKIWFILSNGTMIYVKELFGGPISDYFPFELGIFTVNTTAFIPAGQTVTAIAGGSSVAGFLLSNGSVVFCLGSIYGNVDKNSNGECLLAPIPGGVIINQIKNGGSHITMRSTAATGGRIFFMGTNYFGEQGSGLSDWVSSGFANLLATKGFTEFTAANSSLAGRTIDEIHLMAYGSYALSTVTPVKSDLPIGISETKIAFSLDNIPVDADLFRAEIVIDGSQPVNCTGTYRLFPSAIVDATPRQFVCQIDQNVLESLYLARRNVSLLVAPLLLRVHVSTNAGLILERSKWESIAKVHPAAVLDACMSVSNCPHANTAGSILRVTGRGFGTNVSAIFAFTSPNFIACRGISLQNGVFTCQLDQTPPLGFLSLAVFLYTTPTTEAQLGRYAYRIREVVKVPEIIPSLSPLPATAPVLAISGTSWGTDPTDLHVDLVTVPPRTCQVFFASEQLIRCYTNASANPFNVDESLTAVVIRASGPSARQYVGRTISPPTISAPKNTSSARISMSTSTIRIEGERFGTNLQELNVKLELQSTRRRYASAVTTIDCIPVNVTETLLTCQPTSSFNTSGTLTATVFRQDAPSGSPVLLGNVVTPARVTTTATSVAANADLITVTGSGFAPYPFHKENSVLFSAGDCLEVVNATSTSIVCRWSGSSRQSRLTLTARVFSYGGEAADTNVAVASIVPAPSFTTNPSSYSVSMGTTTLTLAGASFDPQAGATQVLVTYDISSPRPSFTNCGISSVTADQIVCSVPASTLNATGNLYAQVLAFGGSSNYTAVAFVFDPAGTIVGAVVGTLAGLIALGALVGFILYRRRVAKFENQKKMLESQIPKELQPLVNIKSSDIKMMHKLGEGSFGAVFLAEYKGRYCAVKKLSANVISSAVSEFFREASLMLSIKPHRNIVRVFGMCQEMGNFMMLMEFLPRGSLDKFLKTSTPEGAPEPVMEPRVQWRIIRGLATGMAGLAAQNIVHRDLAARNVLLDANLDSKVADFGFSRIVGEDKKGQTNSSVGPIRWMPPESLASLQYSEKSDVWAFASTIFEIYTGREPFEGEDLLSVAVAVRDTGRNPLPEMSQNAPEYIRDLMAWCYRMDPAERPTFQQIVDFLDKSVDPEWVASYKREDVAFGDALNAELGITTTTTKHKSKGNKTNNTNKTNNKPVEPEPEPPGDVTKPTRNYTDMMTNKSEGTATNNTNKKKQHAENDETHDVELVETVKKPQSGNYASMPKDDDDDDESSSSSSSEDEKEEEEEKEEEKEVVEEPKHRSHRSHRSHGHRERSSHHTKSGSHRDDDKSKSHDKSSRSSHHRSKSREEGRSSSRHATSSSRSKEHGHSSRRHKEESKPAQSNYDAFPAESGAPAQEKKSKRSAEKPETLTYGSFPALE